MTQTLTTIALEERHENYDMSLESQVRKAFYKINSLMTTEYQNGTSSNVITNGSFKITATKINDDDLTLRAYSNMTRHSVTEETSNYQIETKLNEIISELQDKVNVSRLYVTDREDLIYTRKQYSKAAGKYLYLKISNPEQTEKLQTLKDVYLKKRDDLKALEKTLRIESRFY